MGLSEGQSRWHWQSATQCHWQIHIESRHLLVSARVQSSFSPRCVSVSDAAAGRAQGPLSRHHHDRRGPSLVVPSLAVTNRKAHWHSKQVSTVTGVHHREARGPNSRLRKEHHAPSPQPPRVNRDGYTVTVIVDLIPLCRSREAACLALRSLLDVYDGAHVSTLQLCTQCHSALGE
jgi:hypothetical protein